MDNNISSHLEKALNHIYINPLEKCNLKCKICYTRKTAPILSFDQIHNFINRYQSTRNLQSITFCGGEVFTLGYFTDLVNTLTNQGLLVQIITNGTIDKLNTFQSPNSINLIVSIDGLRDYHDANRGVGNFETSINFLSKAQKSGYHFEIFSIITRQNYSQISEFEKFLNNKFGGDIRVTYHPRKPPSYLLHNPNSNIFGQLTGFDFLSEGQMVEILNTKNTFPPRELGCYQIALMSTGKVYGCCEGVHPIGNIEDSINNLILQMSLRIKEWEKQNDLKHCLGCTDHKFICGLHKYLKLTQAAG